MMKKIILACFTLFISVYSQSSNKQIAVLELEPVGVSEIEGATLTSRLRSELVNTDSFIVLERGKMDEILKEQGFQMTGCTSQECAVEAGKLLNVRQVVAGQIGKVGNTYSISARIIDIESGKIMKSIFEDCECPIEQVLTASMKKVARKLAGIKNFSYSKIEGKGDIFIDSDPNGAIVFIDNINTGKKTPTTIRNVGAGEHIIRLLKEDYSAEKVVRVDVNNISNEKILLKKNKGVFKIYSNPPQAMVLINNEPVGTTPMIKDEISSGTYEITIRKKGYFDYSKKVILKPANTEIIETELIKYKKVNIRSNPPNALLFIDGKKIGNTPSQVNVRFDRPVKVEIKNDLYENWVQEIDFSEKYQLNVNLSKMKGKISFNNFVKGTQLHASDRSLALENKNYDLPAGKFDFYLSSKGYEDKSFNTYIKPQSVTQIDARLAPKTKGSAFLHSMVVPGWGQYYQEKKIRAWSYGIAFFTLVAGVLYYNNDYNKISEDYNKLLNEYKTSVDPDEIDLIYSKMESTYSEAEGAKKTKNVFAISAGSIWLWNLIDTLILPPSWEKDIGISSKIDSRNMKINIAIHW